MQLQCAEFRGMCRTDSIRMKKISFTLCEMHKVYRGAEGQEGGSRALNEAGRGGEETVQVERGFDPDGGVNRWCPG